MTAIANVDAALLDRLKTTIAGWHDLPTVGAAAQQLAHLLASTFPSVVLSRVFLVTQLSSLPDDERAIAIAAAPDRVFTDRTCILSLLGSAGAQPAWNDPRASVGHRVIPLCDREALQRVPMIAHLLTALGVQVGDLPAGLPVATRRFSDGLNGRFYVEDAASGEGRAVIADRTFVDHHHIRSVFGFGGAYADGRLAVALLFTTEKIPAYTVDLFPPLITVFKKATTAALDRQLLFG